VNTKLEDAASFDEKEKELDERIDRIGKAMGLK